MPTHRDALCEVNLNQLSELTGRAYRTIKKKLASLSPVHVDGKTLFYNAPEALDAIYLGGSMGPVGPEGEQVLDLTQERAKLTQKQAIKVQLEIDVLKKKLIPAPLVERHIADMVSTFRSKVLAIPSRLTAQLEAITDQVERENLIRETLNEALQELSEYEPEDFDATIEDAEADESED